MGEADGAPAGAGPRRLVDQPAPVGPDVGERRADVVNAEGEMMDPLSPLVEELPDRRLRTGRFEELEMALPGLQERDADPLALDVLGGGPTATDHRFVLRERLGEGPDGDPEVVDL